MSSIGSVTAGPVSSFPVPAGALRRRLRLELQSIRSVCEHSGLSDEMTQQIQSWAEAFTRDLRFTDEEGVFHVYVEALQDMLLDPITETPFDALAVLGSDDETYGLMSLAVWKLSVPKELRDRSPLDPENPAPFTVRPHTCVRHMVKWLESHQALLQSKELVTEYLRLLPQSPIEDRQARINRHMARQVEVDRAAAQQLTQGIRTFDHQILDRLHHISTEENKIHDDHSSRVQAVAASVIQTQEQMQEETNRVQEEEALSLEELQQRIEGAVRLQFNSFAGAAAGDGLGTVEERDRQGRAVLQQRIITLESQVTGLTTSVDLLDENVDRVQSLSEIVQQEAKDLQRSIDDTKKAIKKRKIKRMQKAIKTVAIVSASIFASWAAVEFDLLPDGWTFFASGDSSSVGLGFGKAL